MKRVASSLGVSYNRLCHDYESVNFSSLRDAAIDEKIYFTDLQNYLIRNWKERELRYFIEGLALKGDLPASKLLEFKRFHHFLAPRRPYFDPGKEVLAEKYQLELGLKNPLQIISESGYDPDEILRGWNIWNSLCKQYGVDFTPEQKQGEHLATEETNSESDELNQKRD